MEPLHREYQFEEWEALSDAERRQVIHGFWNPYDPRIQYGSPTRAAIATAFREQTRDLPAYTRIKIVYFDKEGWCLTVVTRRSSVLRVPKKFCGLHVIKGVSRTDGSVKWVRM
jgi:hypothetical protein